MTIRFPIGNFLLVILWKQASNSNGFRDKSYSMATVMQCVKGNCCKSNGTNSSGTKTPPRQLVFHLSLIPPVTDVTPFFGHVARLPDDVTAHKALNCHINLSLGRPPSSQWRRRPGRPRSRRVDQLRADTNLPPADLWRRAVNCGHRGATLRPLPANNNNCDAVVDMTLSDL